jgi:hypothetical protein
MKLEIIGGPVFRHGAICSALENIEYEQALIIADKLKNRLPLMVKSIIDDPNKYGFSTVVFIKENCVIEEREGVVLKYPLMLVTFNNITAEASGNISICKFPRHSKIWTRLSYISSTGTKEHDSLNSKDLEYFYDMSSHVCKKWSDCLFDEYHNMIQEMLGINISKEHDIQMKTSSTDLGQVAAELKSNIFSMSKMFDNPAQHDILNGLLYLTFGQNIPNLKQYKDASKTCKWIAMNVNKKDPLIGLYSECQKDNSTTYVGLTHTTNQDPKSLSHHSRDFSRYLLEDLAPMI